MPRTTSSPPAQVWSIETNAARFTAVESSLASTLATLASSVTHVFRRDLLAFYKATNLIPHPQLLPFHPEEEDPTTNGELLHGTAGGVAYDLTEVDTVRIKNWQIDDGSFHGLCFALQHCPKIHTLIFFNVQLRDDEVDTLFNLLPQTQVTRLHLDWNASPGHTPCSPATLTELLSSPSTLTTLSMRTCGLGAAHATAIATALRADTKLEVLTLFDNAIGDTGALEIAYALPFNTTLTSLSLGNTGITGKAAQILVDVLTPRYVAPPSLLQVLEAAEPRIQVELDQAKKAKKKLDRLTVIHTLGLPVLETIDGVPYAQGNTTLHDLILSGNTCIEEHDVLAMHTALETYKATVELYVKRVKLQRIPALKTLVMNRSSHALTDLLHL